MVFVMRKMDRAPQNLGEKLRALRRGQAITLDLLVKQTNIQRKYLEALERGEYHNLPEPVYTRNFIRMYAVALGADEKYFLELYEEESGQCDLISPSQLPVQKVRRTYITSWNHWVKFSTIGAIALFIAVYIGWQMTAVFSAPHLDVTSPASNSVSTEPQIQVSGKVNRESTVVINGQQVPLDANLNFQSSVLLSPGVNSIKVQATSRYSRRALIERIVVYQN